MSLDKDYKELSTLVLAHHKQIKELKNALDLSSEALSMTVEKLTEITTNFNDLSQMVLIIAERIKLLEDKLKVKHQKECKN